MTYELTDHELEKIVENVFQMISEQSTPIEVLPIAEDSEINKAYTLPVVILPEGVEGEINPDSEGELKRIPISKWIDFIDRCKDVGDNFEDRVAGLEQIIQTFLGDGTDTVKINMLLDAINAATTSLQRAHTQLNGVGVNNLSGLNARFNEFIEDDEEINITINGHLYVGNAPVNTYEGLNLIQVESYSICYLKSKNIFVAKGKKVNSDEIVYVPTWEPNVENGLFQLPVTVIASSIVENPDEEQEEVDNSEYDAVIGNYKYKYPIIYKNKTYICETSLYVWSDEEQTLIEISGSGSGSGDGFFNVNLNQQLRDAMAKANDTTEIANVQVALNKIWEYKKDLGFEKTFLQSLVAMAITIYDDTTKSWIDYRNTISKDLLMTKETYTESNISALQSAFTNTSNWVRIDGQNVVRHIIFNGKTYEIDNDFNVTIPAGDLESIVTNNLGTIEETETLPVSGSDIYSYVKNQINAIGETLTIPNALYATGTDEGTRVGLKYVDANGTETLIENSEVLIKGGGGSGDTDGGVKIVPHIYFNVDADGNEVTKILIKEAKDLTFNYYVEQNLDLDNEEKIIGIKILKNDTITIYDSTKVNGGLNNQYPTSINPAQITISKNDITSSFTLKMSVTYLKYVENENGPGTLKQSTVNSPNTRITYATIDLSIKNPTENYIFFIGGSQGLSLSCVAKSELNNMTFFYLNSTNTLDLIGKDAAQDQSVIANTSIQAQIQLSPGINHIYIWCEAQQGTTTIYSNGIYFEVYCTGSNNQYTRNEIVLSNLNYTDASIFFEQDDCIPTFHIKQYDQTTSFNASIYNNTSVIGDLIIQTTDTFGEISDTINTTIPTINNTNDGVIKYYEYNNFFRGVNNHNSLRYIIFTHGNETRRIPLIVEEGNFESNLPSDAAIVFELRAKGKSNSDVARDSWENKNYNTVFNNVKFNTISGWYDNSLILTGNSYVDITNKDKSINLASIGSVTFNIKYRTAQTSNDNYVLIGIGRNNSLLEVTPSTIKAGSATVKVAPDTIVDLTITRSTTSNGGTVSIIYVNGIICSISKNAVLNGTAEYIRLGAVENGTVIPGKFYVYNVALYQELFADNAAIGSYALNAIKDYDNVDTNAIIAKNQVFDLKNQDSVTSVNDLKSIYGDYDETDTYKNMPIEPFLLTEEEVQSLPAGLRIMIIEGPYQRKANNSAKLVNSTATDNNDNDGGWVTDQPITRDIIDTLNEFTTSNKSTRIAGSRMILYISGEESGIFNYYIERPVLSCQGTSSMTYAVKNLRPYTAKKTKLTYAFDPSQTTIDEATQRRRYKNITEIKEQTAVDGKAQFVYEAPVLTDAERDEIHKIVEKDGKQVNTVGEGLLRISKGYFSADFDKNDTEHWKKITEDTELPVYCKYDYSNYHKNDNNKKWEYATVEQYTNSKGANGKLFIQTDEDGAEYYYNTKETYIKWTRARVEDQFVGNENTAGVKKYQTSIEKLSEEEAIDGIARTADKLKAGGEAILKPRNTYNYTFTKKDGIMNGKQDYDYPRNTIRLNDKGLDVNALTVKLDYAESSGTQNTAGARFTNDILNTLRKTPAQNQVTGDDAGKIRTSVDGQTGVCFSYSETGWYVEGKSDEWCRAHKYRFRGKINVNNDKTSEAIFGFKDVTGYNKEKAGDGSNGFPKELSSYAIQKLASIYGLNINSADEDEKKQAENIINNVDVGGVQCWEFSTSVAAIFTKNNNADTFGKILNYSTRTPLVYNGSADQKLVKYVYNFDNTENKSKSYTTSKCIGNFLPLSGSNSQAFEVISKGEEDEDGNVQVSTGQKINIGFNDIIWTKIEGEEQTGNLARPFWATAWESRYPDLGFTLESWYKSIDASGKGSSGQLDPTNANDETTFFQLNPIYLETLYNWVTSFYGNEDDPLEQARFRREVQNYFDLRNLCLYYVLTEILYACDQRVKNMMLTFFYENKNVFAYDKNLYNTDANYKKYGNMEGRRAYFIFYDCDTTFGVDNKGNMTYNWDADWEDGVTGYGVNSTLWKMVRNSLNNLGDSSNIWSSMPNANNVRETYYYDLRTAYDKIREYISTQDVTSNTDSYNIVAGINNGSSYKYILDYYNKDIAAKFSEQLYNKDAFYKYFKYQTRHSVAQGNRVAHKQWWIDNRLKYLDAKYNTGVINSITLKYNASGNFSFSVTGKTEQGSSNFYFNNSGAQGTPGLFNNKELITVQYPANNPDVSQGSKVCGWYWFNHLELKLNTNEAGKDSVSTSDGPYIIENLGKKEEPLKYLKTFKIDAFDWIFRSAATDKKIYTNDNNSAGPIFIEFDNCPSLQTLKLYNEPARETVDLSSCANLTNIDFYKSYVQNLILPVGCILQNTNTSTGIALTPYSETSADNAGKKMLMVLQDMPNIKLQDIRFYKNSNQQNILSLDEGNAHSNFDSGLETLLNNVKSLYISNCENINSADILNKMAERASRNNEEFFVHIDNVHLAGDLDVLDAFLKKDANKKVIYPLQPIVGEVYESAGTYQTRSTTCGIAGEIRLNVYPKESTLAEYHNVFPNMSFIYPDYSYIVIDNFTLDSNGNANINGGTAQRVSNPSNKTGYLYDNEYKPDGHLERILARRHRVLGKMNAETGETVDICQLNDAVGTPTYATGGQAKLNGEEGDVFVYEPHYWFKGVNDWTTGRQYIFVSSAAVNEKKLNVESPKPGISTHRYVAKEKPLTDALTYIKDGYVDYSKIKTYEKNSTFTINQVYGNASAYSTNSKIYCIPLISVFDENQLKNCTHIAFPSLVHPMHTAVIATCTDAQITEASIFTLYNKVDNIFSKVDWTNNYYNEIFTITGSGSNGMQSTYTDNMLVARLPENIDNYKNLYLIVNLRADRLFQSQADQIFNTGSIKYDSSYMVMSDLTIFKPQDENFPWLDVYDWNEHKECLGGVYQSNISNELALCGNDYSKGLTSISGVRIDPAQFANWDRLLLIATKKNNFNAQITTNPGYQYWDYEMQRDLMLMTFIKYGSFNCKYLYGYNYDMYCQSYTTGLNDDLGMESTTSTYRLSDIASKPWADNSDENYTSHRNYYPQHPTVSDKQCEYDSVLGYQHIMTMMPTCWMNNTISNGYVISIKDKDGKTRITNSGFAAATCTAGLWGSQQQDPWLALVPLTFQLGKYCDIFAATYTGKDYNGHGPYDWNGVYCKQNAVAINDSSIYYLGNDLCIAGNTNQRRWTINVNPYNYYDDTFDRNNAGIANIALTQGPRQNTQMAYRMMYRGKINVIQDSQAYINLKWETNK